MSQQKRKKYNISGWLVLDKPQGMTSTQAVGLVKRLLSPEKVGHAGTLDPLATGLLPIALGEATKTVSFAMDGSKTYVFTVRWGVETDTDDAEGKPVNTSAHRPQIAEIEKLLPRFHGRVMQMPPQFSALKIDGARAYDLARDGQHAAINAREIVIERLAIQNADDPDETVFVCDCGKGTYVRAIARDLGRLLGCYGHIVQLRRTRVGPFGIEDAITANDLKATYEEAKPQPQENAGKNLPDRLEPSCLFPVATVLDDIPALAVTQKDADRLRHGQAVLIRGQNAPLFQGVAYASCAGRLLALGEISEGSFLPTRVFNLEGAAAAVPSQH